MYPLFTSTLNSLKATQPAPLATHPEMISSSPDQRSLIRKDDKFYSRLLSKESSLQSCPSFRVYYGVAPASVPFVWESQPGTPKHYIPTTTIPPLTPPPSYDFHPKKNNTRKSSRSNLLKAILSRLTPWKKHALSSPRADSLSSSSISSASSFYLMGSLSSRHSRFSSSRSLFSSRGEGEDGADGGSPTSKLRFRAQREADRAVRRCHSMVIVKNALLSMVGHGSSQGSNA